MDVQTFAAVMGNTIPMARYEALLPAWNQALIQAQCTTVNRVAMWCAQVGHESVGLKYMSEIASGAAYEGRKDLGNTQRGDGVRFKGHGPIQITGRANHAAVSKWAFANGYVPTATYFVDHPAELGADRYGFLGVVWYWTVARRMNGYADSGDIVGATKAVNGGTNGLADRTARWRRALGFSTRLLPTQGDDMDARQDAMLTALYQQVSGSPNVGEWTGWPSWDGGSGRALTPVDYLRQLDVQVTGLKAELETVKAALAGLAAHQAQP